MINELYVITCMSVIDYIKYLVQKTFLLWDIYIELIGDNYIYVAMHQTYVANCFSYNYKAYLQILCANFECIINLSNSKIHDI